jgi:hypothetical protein
LEKPFVRRCKTAHPHSHAEVLTFYKASRNVIRVRLSAEYASATPNAGCRAVAALWRVARGSEYLDEHCIVDIATEAFFHGIGVHPVTVCSELEFIGNPACQVFHEFKSCIGFAGAN